MSWVSSLKRRTNYLVNCTGIGDTGLCEGVVALTRICGYHYVPVLAAFRCMVDQKDDGTFIWDREFDEVLTVWDEVKPTVMDYVRNRGKEVQNMPDAIAKSPAIWQQILTEFMIASGTLKKLA